jgi:hypothetical protein
VAGSCEHGNEPWCSIKGREFLGQLNHYQLLNKGFAPCSYLFSYYYNESFLKSTLPNHKKCDVGTNGRMWFDRRTIVFSACLSASCGPFPELKPLYCMS